MASVLKRTLAAALYALPPPSFHRWIAECVYQRLPKPIYDNFPDYLELFRSLLQRREIYYPVLPFDIRSLGPTLSKNRLFRATKQLFCPGVFLTRTPLRCIAPLAPLD